MYNTDPREMINGAIKELMRGILIAAEPINQLSRALEERNEKAGQRAGAAEGMGEGAVTAATRRGRIKAAFLKIFMKYVFRQVHGNVVFVAILYIENTLSRQNEADPLILAEASADQ